MDLSHLKRGAALDGDSGNDPERVPIWLDQERFRRGQQFFQRHTASAVLALHCSLTIGFAIVNLVQPLAFTNKSETPKKALLRYLQTYVHLVLWHFEDVWDPTTLGHRSTQLVRRMHRNVRKAMNARRTNENNISQYDMSLVQAGFMAAVVMYPSSFGIKCTQRELEDYVYFWRGVGYLLGIDDRYNVCSGNYVETYAVCKEIERDVMFRGLLEPPAEFETMADAYIDGTNTLSKLKMNSKESVIAFSMDIMGHDYPSLRLSWSDRMRIWWLKLVVFLIRWMPGFERFMNMVHRKTIKYFLPLVLKQLDETKS